AAPRNAAYQVRCAGHHAYPVRIVSFPAFEFGRFCLDVNPRHGKPHYFDRSTPVRDLPDLIRIKVHLLRPQTPLPFDRSRRVHQHSIQIKQNCAAIEFFHFLLGLIPRAAHPVTMSTYVARPARCWWAAHLPFAPLAPGAFRESAPAPAVPTLSRNNNSDL